MTARREQLTALGPFFAVATHDPESPLEHGWAPLFDLADQPAMMRSRVDGVRAYLAAANGRPKVEIEPRIAASVMHLGITARLLSPLLALAALADLDHPVGLSDLRWQDVPGGAFPLSVPRPLLEAPSPTGPDWDRWAAALVDGPLAQLSHAVAPLMPSVRIRQGNIASAVHGAVTVLSVARVRALGRLLLDQPALRASSTGEPGTREFRRCSCCLIYRVGRPGARQLCGDCVLAT